MDDLERYRRKAADDADFGDRLAAVATTRTPADSVRMFTGQVMTRLIEAMEKPEPDEALEADLESYEAELMDALGIVP